MIVYTGDPLWRKYEVTSLNKAAANVVPLLSRKPNRLGQPPRMLIYFFISFIRTLKIAILNMLKVKRDINQHDLKIIYLHFVKVEQLSLT